MFILYETTCLVNNKKYIGVHNKEDDDYLGSGKLIRRAVKRHGKNKFSRITLERFDTAEEAYQKESEVVTQEICNSISYYNINLGGFQPPNHTGLKRNSPKYAEANRRRWADPEYKKRASETMKKSHSRRVPCVIDGVSYPSQTAAGEALGLTSQAICLRLRKLKE